jgi:hypothetical protein
MDAFTFGSDDGMNAIDVARTHTGEPYPMTLNGSDFHALIHALREYALGEPNG